MHGFVYVIVRKQCLFYEKSRFIYQQGGECMKIAVAQLNPTVGDIEGNLAILKNALYEAVDKHADLVVFPELFLTGYPPKDLLERTSFISSVESAHDMLCKLSAEHPYTGILLGSPTQDRNNTGMRTYNSALLFMNGDVAGVQHKSLLPTYDVFDETRYFDQAPGVDVIPFKGEKLGINICEDAWNDEKLWPGNRMYQFDPVAKLASQGATLLINISASPFSIGKEEIRFQLIAGHARRHNIPFLYVNQVGGNDELIFDGRSLYVNNEGRAVQVFPSFTESLQFIDTNEKGTGVYNMQEKIETVYEALVLGTRDYLRKCGFRKAVVGLSGGVDSAVTMCIATRALGKENVLGVAMPSPFSSKGSVEDSKKLADSLGIPFKQVPISDVYESYLRTLQEHFEGKEADTTEENIQARIRGNILMAFSNKFNYLVLSTGNKSELAVGYCTLYGDMSGGLALISDVPKTMVYDLARYINRDHEVIPTSIIEKPPSAELKPDQKDQDTLPPYDTLDAILVSLIEEGRSTEEVVARGYDRKTVCWVADTVRKNEYKRNQSAPGLRVTSKAFGVGRRFPIASRYTL
jgi:NAD+ synthase (glutamine-hydrolysing)